MKSAPKQVRKPRTQKCHWCKGHGYVSGDPEGAPIEDCQHCGATGKALTERKLRTWNVWVMLSEKGKPYWGATEPTRQRCLDVAHFWYSGAPGQPIRATLTLTGKRKPPRT